MPLQTVLGRLCGEIFDRIGYKIITTAAITYDGLNVVLELYGDLFGSKKLEQALVRV